MSKKVTSFRTDHDVREMLDGLEYGDAGHTINEAIRQHIGERSARAPPETTPKGDPRSGAKAIDSSPHVGAPGSEETPADPPLAPTPTPGPAEALQPSPPTSEDGTDTISDSPPLEPTDQKSTSGQPPRTRITWRRSRRSSPEEYSSRGN